MADWRMSSHVFIVILVVFSFVWKSEGKFTYGPDADKLCQAYKKVCPRGKLCAIQTLKWPQSMTFPVCVFKHDLHVRSRVCSEAPSPGHCGLNLRRWYFNVHMASCSWFTYTGCGGNGNNFVSREECESVCLSDPNLDVDVSGRNTENLYPRHHVRSDVTRDDRAGQQAAREPYRYSSGRTDNAVDAAASEDLYSHVSEGGLASPYQSQTNNQREEHQTRSQPSSYKTYNNDNYDPRLTSSKADDSRVAATNVDSSRVTSTNTDSSKMTSTNADGSRMISSNVDGSILASAGTDDPRWTFRQPSSSADGSRMGDNVDTDVGNTDASPQRYGPGQRYVGPRDNTQLEYRESPVEHSALTAHPASHRNGNNGNGNHHNGSPNNRNGRNHNYNNHNDRHHNNNNHNGRHHSNNNHQSRHHNNRPADPPLWPDKAADDLMELYYEPGQLVRQPEATDDQHERGYQRGSLARHNGGHDTRMPDARMPDTRMPDSRMPDARNDGRYNLNKLLDNFPRQLDVPDNSDRLKDLAYKPDTETRHHQSRKIPPRLPTATIRRRQPSNLQPLRTLSLLTRHQSLNNRRGAMETATLASSYAPVANETTWDFDEPNNNKPRGGKGGAKSRRGKDGKKRRRNRKGRKRDRKLRKKRRQRRRNNKANDNGGADDGETADLDSDATADLETGEALLSGVDEFSAVGVNEVSATSSNDERGLRAANYTTNSTSNRNKKRKNRKRKNRKRKGRGRRRGKGRKRLQGGDENTPPSTGELTQSSNGFHLQPPNSGMDNDNGQNNHNGLNSHTGLNSHSAGVSTQGKGGNQYYEQIHLFDLLENTHNDTRPSGK